MINTIILDIGDELKVEEKVDDPKSKKDSVENAKDYDNPSYKSENYRNQVNCSEREFAYK